MKRENEDSGEGELVGISWFCGSSVLVWVVVDVDVDVSEVASRDTKGQRSRNSDFTCEKRPPNFSCAAFWRIFSDAIASPSNAGGEKNRDSSESCVLVVEGGGFARAESGIDDVGGALACQAV